MSKKTQKTQNKLKAKNVSLAWSDEGWGDYLYWQDTDQKIMRQINDMLEECKRTPFFGKGKPEPLRADLSGYWSRRITKEHRLVYLPEYGLIYVISCRYHY